MTVQFVQRMLEAQQRERQHITTGLSKVRGLMPLLMKHRNGGSWTVDERHELIEQLHALAHLSPYLVVLLLPGSVLFLPALAWWLDRRRLHRKEAQDSVSPASTFTESPDRRT